MVITLEQDPQDDNLDTRRRQHGWTKDPDQVEKEFWWVTLGEPGYVQDVDKTAEFILNISLDSDQSIYLNGTSGSD